MTTPTRICTCCRSAIHPHQAEEPASVLVDQGGRRREYLLCGACLDRVEPRLGSGWPATLPFHPGQPLLTITR